MEQSTMTNLLKAIMTIFMIAFVVAAENTIFTDPTFPYRIVCKTVWVQEAKNDSLVLLKNSAAGKKTQLRLQKYSIDTAIDFNSYSWSRIRFAVNKELASTIGQLMWFDSLANKKLGNYRAFEICAFFTEKSTTGTTWYGEYSRWTDHGGYGYLASVIGDTADIRANTTTTYKALLDSISIPQLNTQTILQGPGFPAMSLQRFSGSPLPWHDVLGRTAYYYNSRQPDAIVVKKNLKQLRVH
jgi:hypothetical protein